MKLKKWGVDHDLVEGASRTVCGLEIQAGPPKRSRRERAARQCVQCRKAADLKAAVALRKRYDAANGIVVPA